MDNKSKDFPIEVEFTGGLELLFSNERKHTINVPSIDPAGATPNVSWLVDHLCDNLMKDPRKDMFVIDGAVRPGILVLINDADWALEGEAEYALQKNDKIVFLSTLHGG